MHTWIVGLDLSPSSVGAVRFATWFARAGRPADDIALEGMHVIEREQLAPIFRMQSPAEVEQRAQARLDKELDDVGVREAFAKTHLGLGARAHEVFISHAQACGAEAIVIGRRLQGDARATLRLGTNARRLLRRLPCAVVIVPPDYASISFGAGPIIVATNMHDDSLAACRFALAAARRHGRKAHAVHVIPPPDPALFIYAPAAAVEEFAERERAQAQHGLEAWLAGHQLGELVPVVRQGTVVEVIAELVQGERPPLVVTGSQRLPLLERAFVGSTSAAIASVVPVPVAVVPPS